MMGPRTGKLIFSVNSFAAAMLALFVAFSIGLPRPFWAMLTVYITSQPLTGALRSKALYRVIGTAIGGVMAVVLVPNFVDTPILLSLLMAAWTGVCLYLSLLDRTPRAYVFMLAGYTTAIIGFPSVAAPQAIFDTALARVEEITLGILCATLVHTLVFPRDVGRMLGARVRTFLNDGQSWVADALAGRRTPAERDERRRLATDITELHLTASHLPFDTAHLPLRIGAVRALQGRLTYMLPLISALEDRLAELGPPDAALSSLLAEVTAWAEAPDDAPGTAGALRARCRALSPVIVQPADWRTLLTVSIAIRLEELIEALQDSRDLAGFMDGARSADAARIGGLLARSARRRLHLDHGMAALSGLALMAAVLGCCALWIGTAWPEGAVAATMAAVFCSFFAAQDDPAPAIVGFLTWLLLSMPLAALYLFVILPAIDGFPMLCLTLAPALIATGYLQADPAWNGRALALLIGLLGALGLQATFAASLPEFVNGNLAQIVGIGIALAATRLMRSVGAGWAARRILRQGWREVAALARNPGRLNVNAWLAAMLDRVGLVAARAALAAPEDRVDAFDALADMRVGLNLLDLDAAAQGVTPPGRAALRRTLAEVAAAYDARLVDPDSRPGLALLGAIDDAIAGLEGHEASNGEADQDREGEARSALNRGFAALTGLRRNLYPTAAPYLARAA